MKVLTLHNYYQQPGGEDLVVEQEKSLLEANGHEVRLLTTDNDSLTGRWQKVNAGVDAIYSRTARTQVKTEINRFSPDIVHVHNFFPRFTPSIYYACRESNVPVVQTLHNFRLICPNALLFRQGKPCELCVRKPIPFPGVIHGCYRDSCMASAALASMLTVHRFLGTWTNAVDAYIALTGFSRTKLISGGLPAERLFVKPNFLLPDPGTKRKTDDFGLFVGRLSKEKGINTLLAAWDQLESRRKLKIVGDGPLRHIVQRAASRNSGVEFLGHQTSAAVLELMENANFLIFPSECYENFPRVLVEAFAKGLPVVGSRVGSTQELIHDHRTGMLFNPGDSRDLATTIEWLFTHLEDQEKMSREARREFEAKYTGEKNYEQLMEIYRYAKENVDLRATN